MKEIFEGFFEISREEYLKAVSEEDELEAELNNKVIRLVYYLLVGDELLDEDEVCWIRMP